MPNLYKITIFYLHFKHSFELGGADLIEGGRWETRWRRDTHDPKCLYNYGKSYVIIQMHNARIYNRKHKIINYENFQKYMKLRK